MRLARSLNRRLSWAGGTISRAAMVLGILAWPLSSVGQEPPRFHFGAFYRTGMRMEISGGSRADASMRHLMVEQAISGPDLGEPYGSLHPDQARLPAPPGDDLAIGNRDFDDGYNRMSPLTPDMPNAETFFWGYDSRASQSDPIRQEIRYHRATTSYASGIYVPTMRLLAEDSGGSRPHRPEGASWQAVGLRAGGRQTLGVRGAWSWGWLADFAISAADGPRAVRRDHFLFRETRSADASGAYAWTIERTWRETYVYHDVHDVLPFMGESWEGEYDNPGPMIPNTPVSREVAHADVLTRHETGVSAAHRSVSRDWTLSGEVRIEADVTVCSLRLAPELSWNAWHRVGLSMSAGLLIHRVEVDAIRRETYAVTGPDGVVRAGPSWSDVAREGAWLPGVSLGIGLRYSLNVRWSLHFALERDWMHRTMALDLGPERLTLDLEAYGVAFHASRSF